MLSPALKGTIMIINAIIIRVLHTSLRAVIAYFSPKIITFFAKEKFRACRAAEVSACFAHCPTSVMFEFFVQDSVTKMTMTSKSTMKIMMMLSLMPQTYGDEDDDDLAGFFEKVDQTFNCLPLG